MAAFKGDLYARAALRDPYPHYKALRDHASAVYLPRRKMWAVSRFDDVRTVLKADSIFVSRKGVGANNLVNGVTAPITLTSDNETHMRRRRVLIQPVMPPALKELRPRLEAEADRLIAQYATGESFEAMATVAAHLPVSIVADLVGLNAEARSRMLRWASATFNLLGVLNWRGLVSIPSLMQMQRFSGRLDRSLVVPGGWADRLFDAADKGELSRAEAKAMIIDYVAPALDTTILATGHMLWRLAVTPGAYEALRAEPGLVPSVVNEAVRLASPIRGFTRYAVEDFVLGDVAILKEARVLVLFASANHDERHYEAPEEFNIRRNPRDHVGWGHGPHSCVGMHLARLEMEIILGGLLRHVSSLEVGAPQLAYNNVLQGFKVLPMKFHPRATGAMQ